MLSRSFSFGAFFPVMFSYFVMGFGDITGVTSDYAAQAFEWPRLLKGVIPSLVFFWFFVLSVPLAVLINRLGRQRMVVCALAIILAGMVLPLFHYGSVFILSAYLLLGIGVATLQVSLNPLLENLVGDERLMTSTLTAGQVLKALSSFFGPTIVLLAINTVGHGNNSQWYYCFPMMGTVTLLAFLWMMGAPIQHEPKPEHPLSVIKTFGLLKFKRIRRLFWGIFFIVGADVSCNILSPDVMMSRFDFPLENANEATQAYFICRTIGAFIGMLLMTRINIARYFRFNAICALLSAIGLVFIIDPAADFFLIGALGFFCSVMWPILFSTALGEDPDHMIEVNGLMTMAVSGGTISFALHALSQRWGITIGLASLAMIMLYLVWCAFFIARKDRHFGTAEKQNEPERMHWHHG